MNISTDDKITLWAFRGIECAQIFSRRLPKIDTDFLNGKIEVLESSMLVSACSVNLNVQCSTVMELHVGPKWSIICTPGMLENFFEMSHAYYFLATSIENFQS